MDPNQFDIVITRKGKTLFYRSCLTPYALVVNESTARPDEPFVWALFKQQWFAASWRWHFVALGPCQGMADLFDENDAAMTMIEANTPADDELPKHEDLMIKAMKGSGQTQALFELGRARDTLAEAERKWVSETRMGLSPSRDKDMDFA